MQGLAKGLTSRCGGSVLFHKRAMRSGAVRVLNTRSPVWSAVAPRPVGPSGKLFRTKLSSSRARAAGRRILKVEAVFEKFTERSIKSVMIAQQEAKLLGATEVGNGGRSRNCAVLQQCKTLLKEYKHILNVYYNSG